MGFDPGRVTIALHCVAGALADTAISCERPDLTRLLRGRPAEEAATLVPLVYSLCGRAQGMAARAALAAARGAKIETHVDADVWAEAAREHAWKLFVDWPEQFGIAPDQSFFVRLTKRMPTEVEALAAALGQHELPARLIAAAGVGDVAALFGRRVAQRLDAMNDWLADRPGRLGRVAARCLGAGSGEATVETARGPLVHRLTLDGERVADYRIAAPTDTHFAADGEAATWLDRLCGLPCEAAERQARLVAQAFDPCVPWACETT